MCVGISNGEATQCHGVNWPSDKTYIQNNMEKVNKHRHMAIAKPCWVVWVWLKDYRGAKTIWCHNLGVQSEESPRNSCYGSVYAVMLLPSITERSQMLITFAIKPYRNLIKCKLGLALVIYEARAIWIIVWHVQSVQSFFFFFVLWPVERFH